ncbi:hypothetical protein Efla_005071 [Eimeria flavescens]
MNDRCRRCLLLGSLLLTASSDPTLHASCTSLQVSADATGSTAAGGFSKQLSQRGNSQAAFPSSLLVFVSPSELREFARSWPSAISPTSFLGVELPGNSAPSLTKPSGLNEFVEELKKAQPDALIRDVQCTATPLRVNVVNEGQVLCRSHSAANLISLHNVRLRNGRFYGQLLVHHEDGSLAQATNLELPLGPLNPLLFSSDSHFDERTFRGTAICRSSDSQLQIFDGWPSQPDAQAVRRAVGANKLGFFGRLLKRYGRASKRGPLNVLFCLHSIPQGHGEDVNPFTIAQSQERGRDQAYSLLATLILRRALLEAAQQLPALLQVGGRHTRATDVPCHVERSISKVVKEIEWVALVTGLRLRADGSPVLPHRFSVDRLHAELVSRLEILMDDTANADHPAVFPWHVRKLRLMMESMEAQFSALKEKADIPSSKFRRFFDAVAVTRWLALYELLTDPQPSAEAAAAAPELTPGASGQLATRGEKSLLEVQAEEAAELQRQLGRRLVLEATELEQLISGAPTDEAREDRLISLEPWIQQLEEVARVARLSAQQAPALKLILEYGEKGRN